jgi:hypothetical protein
MQKKMEKKIQKNNDFGAIYPGHKCEIYKIHSVFGSPDKSKI